MGHDGPLHEYLNGVATAMAINFTTTGRIADRTPPLVAGTNYYVIGQSIFPRPTRSGLPSSVDNAIAGIAINTSGLAIGDAYRRADCAAHLRRSAGRRRNSAAGRRLGRLRRRGVPPAPRPPRLRRWSPAARSVLALSGSHPGTQAQRTTAAQVPGLANNVLHAGPRRAILTATATIYFTALSVFTVSTLAAWGGGRARRMR